MSNESFVSLLDGTRLWTMTSGSGRPIILLNGGPGMADYLEPFSSLLENDFTIHRFEQRGCGRSEARGPFTVGRFVEDIDELRRHWGYEQWAVVGHSWGVDLGLAYALGHPHSVRALIGLSGGRIHNDRTWHEIYQQNRHKEPPPGSAANLELNQLLNADWREFCKAPDLLANLSRLSVPTLFLYGKNDIRPSWPTQQLSSLLPRATYREFSGADHYPWQANPSGVREAILSFLNTHLMSRSGNGD